MFINGASDIFICVCRRSAASLRRQASVSRSRFRNRSLHSSIRNFLLLCDSEVVFSELRLVWGMRVEVGEELKTGKAALGGAQRAAAELRGRLEKPPA